MQSGRVDKTWFHQLKVFKLISQGTLDKNMNLFERLERLRKIFDYIGFYIYTSKNTKTFLCIEIDQDGELILTHYDTWKFAADEIKEKLDTYIKKNRKTVRHPRIKYNENIMYVE